MTIFISMTDKDVTKLISKLDDLGTQIVRAWDQSNVKHYFDNQKRLEKAVRKNRQTLKSPNTIELFTSSNYLFSTKAPERQETLYFKNHATGRLRQQHTKGPLVKIDKKAKTHRFLSKNRFKFLKEWYRNHKGCLPRFYPYEKRLKIGKHHIEFAYDGKKVSRWHPSGGTVIRTEKRHLDCRIDRALKEILGIRHK